MLQGPVTHELKQTQGKEAGVEYALDVLVEGQQVVEKAQQVKRSQRRSRNRGMEM